MYTVHLLNYVFFLCLIAVPREKKGRYNNQLKIKRRRYVPASY